MSQKTINWYPTVAQEMSLIYPIETFERLFTPTEGGYLFFPSRNAGGKLVTTEEYAKLHGNWKKVAGRKGTLKATVLIVLVIVIWAIAETFYALPEWSGGLVVTASAIIVALWFVWHSVAPWRLVRGRPDASPPRGLSESQMAARSMVPWTMVFAVIFLSGMFLSTDLNTQDRTAQWWGIKLVSGLFFLAYAWIGFQKWRDEQS